MIRNIFTFFLILFLLFGCTNKETSVSLPIDDYTCPEGVKAPPAPPLPRTVESLAKWSIDIELAREATQKSLDICSQHLQDVLSIIKTKTP